MEKSNIEMTIRELAAKIRRERGGHQMHDREVEDIALSQLRMAYAVLNGDRFGDDDEIYEGAD